MAGGKELWSQQFDGATGDLFTLEDEIYNPLVAALNLNPTNEELAKAEARPTENVAAYDLYLRGRNSLRGHDAKSIQTALDFFDQALKNDRTFALAYTGIADASLRMYGVRKDSLWTQKALAAAQQAQQLNDTLPEVHSVLGARLQRHGQVLRGDLRAESFACASTEFGRILSAPGKCVPCDRQWPASH